ncbi:hypothetical protein [Streptomyces sp. RerS4]|uniref:hypothetical protein n=1 Tax=Streptomyces sp. RerS4 TaxID=2942449 RepID=UPI00201C41C8|nr:hypothetical protein [Streptomyces sp. RerS4]UQX04604.1 hypothetical protein M4D82_31890 [Streptomyces sp. RerS4]
MTIFAAPLPTASHPADACPTTTVPDQLVFRTTLSVPTAERDVFAVVRSESITWIKTKQTRYPDAPSTSGVHHLGATTVLTNQSRYDETGVETALRIQLREDQPAATWRTTITAALAPPGAPTAAAVAVSLECFPNGTTEGLRPGRPAIVKNLVARLSPFDGDGRLTVNALQVGSAQVDHLIEVLCDPDRLHPVVVAARTTEPDPLWSQRMRTVMPQCAGSAGLYLLADPKAVDAFRHEIGEHHRVAPGAVRTFLPGTDPAWAPDAARHRFVSPARMRDSSDNAWTTIARAAQRHATQAPIPEILRDLRFPDDEAATQRRREALAQTITPHPRLPVDALNELRHLREENALLLDLLKTADEEVEEKRTSTRLAERATASLEAQLALARQESLHNLQDAVEALEEAQRARTEANQLRSRLYQQDRHEDATDPVEVPQPLPTSFEELWDRREAFSRLLFTADRDTCIDLDENDRARVWAGKAWVALRALDSYAEQAQQGFKGAFYDYCTAPLPGVQGWPAKQVAMAEGSQTMAQYGGQRVFPVPTTVDPSGRAVMEAHIKLDSKGATSPRVHFLDDTKGTTQMIIIGYVGPHLRNTKTN